MITLLKILPEKWEKAKGFLRLDLEAIEAALNTRWSAVFGDSNLLQPGAVDGDYTVDSRYVSNQGTDHLPYWDQVDLSNGVKDRLPFSNLVAATVPSILVGRRSGSAGDFEEISLGSRLSMLSTTLNVDLSWIPGSMPIPDEPYRDDPWPISAQTPMVYKFTTGSVIFAGATGDLAQDNANLFWNDTDNRLGIGTAAPTVRLTVSENVTTLPAPRSGTVLHLGGVDAATPRMFFDTFGVGQNAEVAFRKATGNNGSQTAVELDDVMGGFAWYGYGATAYGTTPRAALLGFANATWTDASQPIYIDISTTATGSTTRTRRVRFGAEGNVNIGAGTVTSNGTVVLEFEDGTAPTTTGTNKACIYANDVGGTVRMFAIDEAGVTGALAMASGALTSGRVALITTNGLLTDDSDLTFSVDTLSVPSVIYAGSANNRAVGQKVLYGATTDAATAVELTTNGSAGSGATNRIAVPANAALSVVLNIAVKQSGSANAKQMLRQFVLSNNGGTTALQGSVTTLGTDVGSVALTTVTCTITANDTDDCIKVEVNGVAATNLRYTAYLVSAEVIYS